MAKQISLEQLVALCEQIASVARFGTPIDRALVGSAESINGPHQPAFVASIQDGTDLATAIDRDPTLPPILKSVVAAGCASGRLSVALESLTDAAKRVLEIRRKVSLAFIYPSIVLMLIAILTPVVLQMVPYNIEQFKEFQQLEYTPGTSVIVSLLHQVADWIWIPAVVIVGMMTVWVFAAGRAANSSNWLHSMVRFFPWVGRLIRLGSLATFTDLLAIFVEEKIPLAPALEMSAEATGDLAIVEEAASLASGIEQGQTTLQDVGKSAAIPNLIRWQLSANLSDHELAHSLRSSSRAFRQHADQLANRCSVRLPVYLTVFVGGTFTVLYGAIVLLPWYSLLKELSL